MAIKKLEIDEEQIEGEDNTQSRQIPVDSKEEEAQSVKVDFQEEDLASEFASKQTKTSSDQGTIDPNTSADKLQKDILDYENSKSGKLEYKDFLKIAEFLITLIDTSVSTALNWWAKDTSSTAYSLPASNRKLLTEQLALILAKYQSKFSIEFMFFMGLIVMYAPSFMASMANRKTNMIKGKKIAKELADKEKDKQPGDNYFRHNPEEPKELPPTPIKEEINVPVIKKRRPGKQPKAY